MGVRVFIEIILACLYMIFSLLLLPYGYNCFFLVYASKKYSPKRINKLENHPLVTIQLPIFNEKYVVVRLINAVSYINWPRDRLQILVLDDSSDDTSRVIDESVNHLSKEGHNLQVIRRSTRDGYKAGALQNALFYTWGKYVAIFDADFLPPPNFLTDTVPLLEKEPRLGLVQTRWGHINRDYSKLTETFAIGIDGHHLVEQTGRSAWGLLMNFNGSCGVLRTKAIIDAGGWTSDTLSEDMDLSYRMQLNGWKSTYVRDLVVPGEVTPNIPAFRNQQARWAKGSIQCGRKLLRKVWASNRFSITQKIQATIHMTYYMIHLLMLSVLILAIPLLAAGAFSLVPFYIHYMLLFGLCAVSSTTLYYTSIHQQKLSFKNKLPYLGLLSIVGYGLSARCSLSVMVGLMRYGGFFERTPKYNIRGKNDEWRSKIYKPLSNLPLLESFFASYSLFGVLLAVSQKIWSISFYLSVYLSGYILIAYYLNRHKV
jgi:cellulose synthase/poly-beta-1,6-N-acetylglucosamine synthase-like glycosyltransferase